MLRVSQLYHATVMALPSNLPESDHPNMYPGTITVLFIEGDMYILKNILTFSENIINTLK